MNILNAKLNNDFVPNITTRATREMDAKITLGVFALEFKGKNIKMVLEPVYRDANKQLIVDIERIVHNYIGVDITGDVIKQITAEVMPFALQIDTNV